MDRQERIDLILDHYEHPRHAGRLDPADVIETGYNPGCGDEVTVYLRLNDDERTVELAFEGQGCTISQAAASMVIELWQGQPLEQIATSSADVLLGLLGPDIAATRPRCSTLALEALKAAGRAIWSERSQVLARSD